MNLRASLALWALIGIAASAAVPVTAMAQPGDPNSLGATWSEQQDAVRQCVRENRCLPLTRVIELIRRETPGKQLDAGLEPGPSGRAVYRVRWAADNGKRLDYLVDVVNGAIVRVEGR